MSNETATPLKTFRVVREIKTSTYERVLVNAAEEWLARDIAQKDIDTVDTLKWSEDGEPDTQEEINIISAQEEIDGVTVEDRIVREVNSGPSTR